MNMPLVIRMRCCLAGLLLAGHVATPLSAAGRYVSAPFRRIKGGQ